jgi:hypothetical protein
VARWTQQTSPVRTQCKVYGFGKLKQAAAGAEVVGCFDCQGELAKGVKLIMKISPSKRLRSDAKKDNSKGQPDQLRLEKAQAFAKETMSRVV